MGKRGESDAVPLDERRCTECGRGVKDGARFYTRPQCGPNSYRPVCAQCDVDRVRASRAEARAILGGR